MTATASVPTDRPLPYMRQLCKHFGHKTKAEYGEDAGHIVLGDGRCELDASAADRLVLTAAAPDQDGLERVMRVIASHLERFGRRDELTVAWETSAPAH